MRYPLIVVALGLVAFAPAQFRRNDDQQSLAGRYSSVQSGSRIKRLLILDRDGRCEIVTTDDSNDRRDLSRDDVRQYGTTAQKARSSRRPVRHVGRWEADGTGVRLRLQDVVGDLKGPERFDVRLDYRNGALTFDKDTEAYGTERMAFRREYASSEGSRDEALDLQSLAGRYTAARSGSRVKRVLTLDRDGRCEIVTTDDANDRRTMSRDDVRRYGTTADKARSTGRRVRHVGRWEADGRGIRLRLEDVIGDLKGAERFDVRLDYRNGALTFDKDTEAYGTERTEFRREGGRRAARPFGAVR